MDDELVREVFDASYRRLVGQLFAVCGDLGDAEEVVQEAFVRAVQNERKFVALDNPEAWLRTVAVNLARSRHSRRALGHRLLRRSSATIDTRRSPELGPDHVALVTALKALPRTQREAIALYYLADLPVEEVARTVGAPAGTVKARLSRGRAALAALLPDASGDKEPRHA
jgi:RNA polymerase sigma-70 factor, ECF subfamily